MRRRYKLAIAAAALLLVASTAFIVGQERIGMALFTRAVDARVGRDVTTSLPDGLHVVLCGTGSPLPNPTRAGPCNVVIAGKRIFVVDIGEGGARNINLMGIPVGRIEGLLLTHFHSDHIDGMGPLMLGRWTSATRTTALPVIGPAGVEQIVAGFNTAYRLDQGYRISHHGPAIVPPSGAGWVARPFALPDVGQGDTQILLDNGGLKITAIRVDHGPVGPAVGYRFDYKGRSIVISGDTKPSKSLIAASRGADLLIHEALQPRMVSIMTAQLDKLGAKALAQITRDIVNYHTTPEAAAEIAQAAGVKQLILSHIVPSLPAGTFNATFLGDAPDRFEGPVIVGEDGMIFSLRAEQTSIVGDTLM
jgi:ribonuclease Z